VDIGGVPHIAFLEVDKTIQPQRTYVYVKFWDGANWVLKGTGPLNRSTSSTTATSVSIVADGGNPYVAWTEYTYDAATGKESNAQVFVSRWTGTQWVPVADTSSPGVSKINVTAAGGGIAADAAITFSGGRPYVAWTEATAVGNAQLLVKTFDGTNWVLAGTGSLNRNSTTGWAFRPAIVPDGSGGVYVGWVEQHAIGQRAQAHVSRFSSGTWTALGTMLNADAALGSAQRITLAFPGKLTAAWGEVSPGSTRQIVVKEWNGTNWTLLGDSLPVVSSCDLNSDGAVNAQDVQLAKDQALGTASCSTADVHRNGTCNVVDVQRIINAALGGACTVGP
jgi:hypothetical protein